MTGESSLTLGIDLGGTKISSGLVDEAGHLLAAHRRLTHPEKGPAGIIRGIIALAREAIRESNRPVPRLGIGVAGQVDRATGTVWFAPNLGWRDVPLQAELEAALGIPVTVTNDVVAATWGEWRFGAGRGVSDLVCLFIGTGVGGGIISGGRLLEGCGNTAGELGHLTIVTGGRKCRCPGRGCLEAYAGGWAIAERAQEAVRADPAAGQKLIARAGGAAQITAATVAAAYREADPLAVRLVEETANYLAAGLVSITNALNPCRIIIGGGVAQGLPQLIRLAEPGLRENALAAAVRGLRLVRAELGERAGVVGAATRARESGAVS